MNDVPVEIKKTAAVPATGPSWQQLRQDFERLFDRWPSLGLPSIGRLRDFDRLWPAATAGTLPAIDVSEDDNAFKITAELPGIEEKDIDVSIAGDTLTLKGEKRQEKEEKKKNYYLSERSYGSFQRSFALPEEADRDKISAAFAKGVLTVTLPKTKAAQQQKKIEVKAA